MKKLFQLFVLNFFGFISFFCLFRWFHIFSFLSFPVAALNSFRIKLISIESYLQKLCVFVLNKNKIKSQQQIVKTTCRFSCCCVCFQSWSFAFRPFGIVCGMVSWHDYLQLFFFLPFLSVFRFCFPYWFIRFNMVF